VSFDTTVHIREYSLRRVCTCTRICTICSFEVGGEGGGIFLVRTLVAGLAGHF